MPKIKFNAYWFKEMQTEMNIPKGFIVLRYEDFYRKSLGKFLLQLDEYQKKQLEKIIESKNAMEGEEHLKPIEINLEYHFRKRTLDQNALLWSLYEIEANEQNGGMKGAIEQMVTPLELYEADLYEFGERETVFTTKKNLDRYLSEYRIIVSIKHQGLIFQLSDFLKYPCNDDESISITGIRGSSWFNIKTMALWIDMIFNRISYHGVSVTEPGHIEKYWKDWKQGLNDHKIIIHDSIMTQAEYKAFTPICEACGQFIPQGEGDLSHIKSVGMGGDRTKEPKRNYTSNWLHLCTECHRVDWHQDGYKSFLQKYSHLRYKVNTALSRDYDNLPE